MKSIRKNPVGALLYDYGMITAGAVLYVFALKVFITPMQIPSGGIAGLALLCNYILGLPFGVVTIVMNVPLLLFGYKMLGRDFFFKTLYMTVLSSVLTDLAGFLPAYDGDILLAALFGGIIKGVGFGLVIRSGGTAGGSDVISKYIFRKRSIPIGTTNMTLNVCVLLMSAFFLKSIESLFYGIITQYVVSVVMDHIIYGSDVQKEAMIITSKPDEISQAVLSELRHGVTAIEGKGMYTGQERTILLVVIRRHETNQLKKLILNIDEGAFMMLSDTSEVLGRGFKHMKID
ncbi:MAG: YitT family protein [Ruminococcaceae bacterium]|nr:YitT family protein [Oscillospiraceae bacterium]MBQ4490124.1 YitT family protein [Pyramidobacter sp.]